MLYSVHGLIETHPKFSASDSPRFRLSHTRRYSVLPDAFRKASATPLLSDSLRFRLSHTRHCRVLPDAFRSYPEAKPGGQDRCLPELSRANPGGQSDGMADAFRSYPEANPDSQSDGVAKVTGKRGSCLRGGPDGG